ncbi:hypothetical protein B0H11DRAFT_1995997 [Mycena galericulata]|nr:hypothetical protein B0H11DRAFT_1995997 [Mycena galericulata]
MGVTLTGIQAIAMHCAHLRTLGLLFDASSVPSGFDRSCVQRTLTQLDVSHSPISSPNAIARVLSALFPNLKRIYANFVLNPDGEATYKLWKEVNSILKSR